MKLTTQINKKHAILLWKILPWFVLCTFLILTTIIVHKIIQLQKEKESVNHPPPAAISVITQTIQPLRMVDHIDLPAVVAAWEDLTIKAEVVGKVIAVHVKEGDHVKSGQTLVKIDSRDYENQLQSIKAQHLLAEANYKRLDALIGKGAVSQSDYDKALATLNELNAAKKIAKLNLERCTIKAPFGGTINDLPAKIGLLLTHGDPVAQLLDISRIKVEVSIPEAEVAAVQKIDSAKVVFSALDNHEVQGKKIFLSKKPLTNSLVYTLRLKVENPDEKILPGMFARVDIVKSIHEKAFGVPLFSVITRNDEKFVYVIENNKARKRIVQTGFLDGWLVRIISGIEVNDQVVAMGHRNLEDGQPVNVIKTVSDPHGISL